jgi:serine/threonine protein phosphatase PrpC
VASRLAVATVERAYREAPGLDPLTELRAAVGIANLAVHEENQLEPFLPGMGTTCTAAVVRGNELYLAHVGDSRAYLVRDGSARQLTRDHSLAAELVAAARLTPEAARADPRRNLLTRSMGFDPEVEVDAARGAEPLVAGDTLLLCSDGLHGLVRDPELARAVRQRDLARAGAELLALANARGGPDNITVVLARLGGAPSGDRTRLRRVLFLLAAALGLALVALALWVGLGRPAAPPPAGAGDRGTRAPPAAPAVARADGLQHPCYAPSRPGGPAARDASRVAPTARR